MIDAQHRDLARTADLAVNQILTGVDRRVANVREDIMDLTSTGQLTRVMRPIITNEVRQTMRDLDRQRRLEQSVDRSNVHTLPGAKDS
ncbi:MAG: hypothetical protein ABW000_07115 [Actinoplanes sp.]